MILNKKILFNYDNFDSEFRTILKNDVNKSYIDGLKKEKLFLLNIPNEVTISSQKKIYK
jgi:hypothetical protein